MTVTSAQTVINALGLPDGSRVNQRVPKKLLLENGAFTAADKRLISDSIEEIQWITALKPNTIGVPVYRDALREYLEIAVLAVRLRGVVKLASASRLAELVHRAVPYPVLLLLINGPALVLSLAHKRWAQNETDKVVLDDSLLSASLFEATVADSLAPAQIGWAEVEGSFLDSLTFTRQPQATLYAIYQGWMDCVQALLAARLTGRYRTTLTPEQALERRHALGEYERLETDIKRLRTQAVKEKQMARQVSINLELKALLADRKRIEQYL